MIDGLLELGDVEDARDRIAGRVHRTPLLSATSLGDLFGIRLSVKAELFQKTGSFKPRGVFNKLLQMGDADLARGLVSISAGNHAAALAYGGEGRRGPGHHRDAVGRPSVEDRGHAVLRR